MPFAPMKLSHMVRNALRSVKFAAAGDGFVERLRTDSALFLASREMLRSDSASTVVLERLESRGHKLAGVAGVFGFEDVSGAASLVEEAIIEKLAGRGTPGPVETSLDGLIKCVEWAVTKEGAEREKIKAQVYLPGIVEPAHRVPKVLIADDDPSIVRILTDRCASAGFEVQAAINGLQALIMARRSHPDILIVDVNMPELNGLDVSARLLDPHARPIDVVVITGSANPETLERCESLGAFYARKGPDFWNSIACALAEIVPAVAERIKELAIAPMGAEAQPRPYLLSRLRGTAATEDIPVLVMSGRRLGEITEQMLTRKICGRPGAARIFRKSFEAEELCKAVQVFCGFEINRWQDKSMHLLY